jgi:hypothetical protein
LLNKEIEIEINKEETEFESNNNNPEIHDANLMSFEEKNVDEEEDKDVYRPIKVSDLKKRFERS